MSRAIFDKKLDSDRTIIDCLNLYVIYFHDICFIEYSDHLKLSEVCLTCYCSKSNQTFFLSFFLFFIKMRVHISKVEMYQNMLIDPFFCAICILSV